jgi:hypothetical protein
MSDCPSPAYFAPALRDARAPTPWGRFVATLGPGLLVMLADTDAGNAVTAAQAGAQWGYRLLGARRAVRLSKANS